MWATIGHSTGQTTTHTHGTGTGREGARDDWKRVEGEKIRREKERKAMSEGDLV